MVNTITHHPLLRHRDGHHARVTFEELFFDLVYVFAITQLSHSLLHHLTILGAIETLILWFAVWLGWQYTCWMTNWFDPEQSRMRMVLFCSMLLALVMAAAIPDAFSDRSLIFAGCYVAMQVGRSAFIVYQLGDNHPLTANYNRILTWLIVSGCFWIGGALTDHEVRIGLWIIAILCEYISPMFGFPVPGMGRSHTNDWTIEGGHLAERCQLFVIVALGESLLATGATLTEVDIWSLSTISALGATFLGTLAMWWLYFGTSSKDATTKITKSKDPGKLGAYFHYVHAILIIGIITSAVGNDLAMEKPSNDVAIPQILVIMIGPSVFLLACTLYKRIVYGYIPLSHICGVMILFSAVPIALHTDLVTLGWITTIVLLMVAIWERNLFSPKTII